MQGSYHLSPFAGPRRPITKSRTITIKQVQVNNLVKQDESREIFANTTEVSITMNVVLLPTLLFAAYLICCTTAFQSPQQSLIHHRSSELWSDDSSDDRFDVFQDELDEPVLRINFSYDDDDKGNLALSAIQNYTRSFPFVAVLPVQPLTYLPGMNHIIILCCSQCYAYQHLNYYFIILCNSYVLQSEYLISRRMKIEDLSFQNLAILV